ncbi:MAG: hypothetical protein HW385_1560 [candidate division NC10 bacterium]|nr:hypothetical protein [candidate division NC10 bacterium]
MGRKTGICEESASDLAALFAQAIPFLLRQFESDDEEGRARETSALKALDDPSLIAASIDLQEALEGPRSTEAPR